MKAYKVWHDTKHFIHKDTTDDMNVQWTTNIEDAKDVNGYANAIKFFCDLLGFDIWKRYDALHLM
jgi:hypothetical protein